VVAGPPLSVRKPSRTSFPGQALRRSDALIWVKRMTRTKVLGLSASARPGAEGEDGTARWRETCGVTVRLPGISYDVVRNSRHPLPADHTGTQRQRRHEPNYARRRYWTARITFSTGSFPEFYE
jgi:hypothetical protein